MCARGAPARAEPGGIGPGWSGAGAGWYRGPVASKLSPEDFAFLKAFYQQVAGEEPLDPADRRYVELYRDAGQDDPVELMFRGIAWQTGKSAQLLSGFRGTGKSTELRRLRDRLRASGYVVVLLDMEDYLNMSTKVEVSDFLMAVAGGYSDALAAPDLLGFDPKREGYWTRLAAFLRKTRIEIPDVAEYGVKAALKTDPTFKQRLQSQMAGHLGALTDDVHEFFQESLQAIHKKYSAKPEVVLIVDSMEHVRGTSMNDRDVQASLVNLFAGHAPRLKLPNVHVVYTVPPYLKVLSPSLGDLYGAGAIQIFPAIKVHKPDGDDPAARAPHDAGVLALQAVLRARGTVERLFASEDHVRKLVRMSGGHLRDVLRLTAEVLRRAQSVPVGEDIVDGAIRAIRAEMLPIADEHARWLARIAVTRKAELASIRQITDLAAFLDSHVVLCFKNGQDEYYDVHPLIREHVLSQARDLERREETSNKRPGDKSGGP